MARRCGFVGQRSLNSDFFVPISFVNLTNRDVEILWINYLGQYASYRLLPSQGYVDINTFKTHPWVAIAHDNRERLHIEKEFIYQPLSHEEYLRKHYPDKRLPPNIDQLKFRVRAAITTPLHSLRYMSMLTTSNLLREPDEVEQLDLPKPIENELKKLISNRNKNIITAFLN